MSRSDDALFDLAPRRKRPLSLWNPVDYLVLLYWAFFFPQALRWYVETFGRADCQKDSGFSTWQICVRDTVQRHLTLQAIALLLIPIVTLVLIRLWIDIPISLDGTGSQVSGLMIGFVALGLIGVIAKGAAFGLDVVVAGILSAIIAGGVALGLALAIAGDWGAIIAGATAFSLAFGLIFAIASRVDTDIVFAVIFTVFVAIALITILAMAAGVSIGIAVGVTVTVAVASAALRVIGWSLSLLSHRIRWSWAVGRRTYLPLPRLHVALGRQLTHDWSSGTKVINQVLAYSNQFITVNAVVNQSLSRSQPDLLLQRVASLAHQPFDWDLLRYSSASLGNALRSKLINGFFFFIPKRQRRTLAARYPSTLRLDTPARAACAGFWSWHAKDTSAAAAAFEQVRTLRFGPELAGIAHALQQGEAADTIEAVIVWQDNVAWLDDLPKEEEERLRPGTLAALESLRRAAADVATAQGAYAPLNRTASLGRAAATLQDLIEQGAATCPEPEWPIIHNIAQTWRDLVVKAGGKAGEEVTRQRVINPYDGYSGLPVSPPAFVGRVGAMEDIQRHWAGPEDPPVIVLYGHRRMGKTSILRNLQNNLPDGGLLVYLDAQGLIADNAGQFLLDIAEAIHERVSQAGLDAGPPPTEADYDSLGRARRRLSQLLDTLAPQMTATTTTAATTTGSRRLILAFDEFEFIQDYIDQGRIDAAVLHYFRSINQKYRWLALIFGGLHTMDEMGKDYRGAFYAQTEQVRVSYLAPDAAVRLITQPHPDFPLEYQAALRDELFRLTYGQPFLLQRLCWAMVEGWNDRFERQRGTIEYTLTLDDLAPVVEHAVSSDSAYAYYFTGVWNNISADEQTLMTLLAQREQPWPTADLMAAWTDRDMQRETFDATVAALRHHDVIIEHRVDKDKHDAEHGPSLGYASELLRRWVARHRIEGG